MGHNEKITPTPPSPVEGEGIASKGFAALTKDSLSRGG